MRAILIDPFTKRIEAVSVAEDEEGDANYESLRRLIFGEGLKGFIEVCNVGAGICVVVDEEGYIRPWSSQGFFDLTGNLGQSATFAGRALLMGRGDWGDLCDCPMQIGDIRVAWREPQSVVVEPPSITTFGDDGKAHTEAIGTAWTFDNQPAD